MGGVLKEIRDRVERDNELINPTLFFIKTCNSTDYKPAFIIFT